MGVEYDLVVNAGRVFCADTGLDGPGAVAVKDGRIVASGPDVSGSSRETLDFPDCVLLPGLVDMHAHPAPSTWKYGIDPDVEILPRGTTTILSQGDSGAAHWPVYRDTIVRGSKTRIRLAISAAINGESGKQGEPCFGNIDELDVDAAVAAINDGGDDIWGVAVNVAQAGCGKSDPRLVLARTIEMAERTGRPILFGERWEPCDWPLSEQLEGLRPGDGRNVLPARWPEWNRRRWESDRLSVGGAGARRAVRHRSRHGVVRLRRRRGRISGWVPA